MKKRTILLIFAVIIVAAAIIAAVRSTGLEADDDYPAEYKAEELDAVVDRWNFYNRECTSFVAWRLNSRNNVPFTNQYGGVSRWGNAANWGSVAEGLGILVDAAPAEGSVAWWKSGHVAWVRSVKGKKVVIEEYNVPRYSGKYGIRTINASAPDGYIHIKDID